MEPDQTSAVETQIVAETPTAIPAEAEKPVAEAASEFIVAAAVAPSKKKFLPVDWPVLSRAKKPEAGKHCYRIYKDAKEFVDVAAKNVLDALHSTEITKPFKIMTPFCGKEVMITQTELLAS